MSVVDDVRTLYEGVAERIGGSCFVPVYGFSRLPVVQLPAGDWIITLHAVRTESGPATHVRAPFQNSRGVRLRIRGEGVMDDLWKKLGLVRDFDSGDPEFDRRFVVQGSPPAAVRELVESEPFRTLLAAQRRVDIRVLTYLEAYPRPPGVEELYFQEVGWMLAGDRLAGLFDLFQEVLRVLSPSSQDFEDDPDLLLHRLATPGGKVEAAGVIYWDGDAIRRDAAIRLGGFPEERVAEALLATLGEDDPELVAASATALGRLGNTDVVPRLIELLGRRGRADRSAGLAARAGEVLATLGSGTAVDAFERALTGEPDGLTEFRGDVRSAIVRALMSLVESGPLAVRPYAARALGALGAAEALPLLRDEARGLRTRLVEEARAALELIEQRASLPRPAQKHSDAGLGLPRPAEGAQDGPERLPRPAQGE